MSAKQPRMTDRLIAQYLRHLKEQERSAATIQKYTHDLEAFCAFLSGKELTKAVLIDWKQELTGAYATSSVNAMLTAVNGFLRFYGWGSLCVKLLKIQRALSATEC